MASAVEADNYYAILEVSQFASLESIRESYKRLALKFHPDKNQTDGATSHFQRLAIAWETLKDERKRLEYDRKFVKSTKRKRDNDSKDEAGPSRRWRDGHQEGTYIPSSKEVESGEDAVLRGKARAWRSIAREDYLSRLQTWIDFREQNIPKILEVQQTLRQQEIDLTAQTGKDEVSFIRIFQDAISRSISLGQQVGDRSMILAKLLEARRSYILRLSGAVAQCRRQLKQLTIELENDRRRYEEEECRTRALRIGRALELLGPRELNAPLFSLIDRRGKAINCWKALSRIKPAIRFAASLKPIEEGPWHMGGDWERVAGEQSCGRCGARAFHLIPECGPAKCPGCEMIACIDCHRSLLLLQEYERWITSPADVSKDSLFAVVFSSEAKPTKK